MLQATRPGVNGLYYTVYLKEIAISLYEGRRIESNRKASSEFKGEHTSSSIKNSTAENYNKFQREQGQQLVSVKFYKFSTLNQLILNWNNCFDFMLQSLTSVPEIKDYLHIIK